MAVAYDFSGEIRRCLICFADHERGELNLMLVHQIENTWNALIVSICKERIGWEIWHALFNRIRNHSCRPRNRLATAFEHKRYADRQASSIGPERISVRGAAMLAQVGAGCLRNRGSRQGQRRGSRED